MIDKLTHQKFDKLITELIEMTERTMLENKARTMQDVEVRESKPESPWFELAKQICVDPFRRQP